MGGGGSSGGGTTTTKTTAELPEYAKPYAIQMLERGAGISNTPFTRYTGQRIADFTPEQQQALGLATDRALTGNAAMNAGNDNLQSTLRGDYLNVSNAPGFQQGLEDIKRAYQTGTAAQTDAAFNKAGAYGGSAYKEMVGQNERSYGDSLNKFAGDQYQAERMNQQRAAALAPQYAANEYTDINALAGVGDVRQGRTQDYLNQEYQDWFSAMEQPYRNLDVLGQSLAGSVGGAGSTTSTGPNPNQRNPISGAIGGAGAGIGLGSMLGFSGLGPLAPFAIGGGLLGLF